MLKLDYERLSADEIPDALAQIEKAKAILWTRLVTPTVDEPQTDSYDLTPDDVGARLGKDRRWVYRHARDLHGKKLGRRTWRFSEAGLRTYLQSRG